MITIQQIITAVKEINGDLAGISRTNRALWHSLTTKCNKLEKELASSDGKFKVAEDSELSAEQVVELVAKFETEMAKQVTTNEDLADLLSQGADREEGMAVAIDTLQKSEQASAERINELEAELANLPKLIEGTNSEQSIEAKNETQKEETVGSKGEGGGTVKSEEEKKLTGLAAIKAKQK